MVDNGSHDGSLEYLRDAHPEVVTVALGANTGFAHAANVGLRRSSGEFVALVNTDVELAPDWLARDGRRARSRPRRGGGGLQDGLAVGPEPDLRRRRHPAPRRRLRAARTLHPRRRPLRRARRGVRCVRRRGALPPRPRSSRWAASMSATSPISRTSTSRCGCGWPAGAAATSRWSRATPARDRRTSYRGGHHLLVARNTIVLVAMLVSAAVAAPGRLPPGRLAVARGARTAPGGAPPRAGRRGPDAPGRAARAPRAARHRRPCRSTSRCRPARPGPAAPAVTDPVARTCHRRNLPGVPLITGERVTTATAASTRASSATGRRTGCAPRCSPPGACSTSAAASGIPIASWRRGVTVGVDVDAEALADQERETRVRRHAPAAVRATRSFASVLSVQSIEHVPDPERVLAEVARVLERPGRAMLRHAQPADVRRARRDHRPLPLRRVRPRPAARRCAEPFFDRVEIKGLAGSARYDASRGAERRELHRLLALDPLRLRRLIPRRAAPAALRLAAQPATGRRRDRGRSRSSPTTSGSPTLRVTRSI